MTCALDYIKDPDNKTSNCVENCNYFYYYDIFDKYICTNNNQCPEEANLLVRTKDKCTSKCTNEVTNTFQYNGECFPSCPGDTTPNSNNICEINNIKVCSTGEFKLDLNEAIVEENVQLVAKTYAAEFYYTENHISSFTSSKFTMVLYKNSSCIDELKLNITKIDYESCIQQLKIDNNIDEKKDLIIAVVDIINKGNIPNTSFGFFNPDTGEKLNATKSCSNKNVTMYGNVLPLVNDPLALQLLEDQKIDIFDLTGDFYNDICFHFISPNGKDSTLQDRMKAFYPNVTLCNEGCRNKGINLTTMEAECECIFQDLLNKNIFENDLIKDNIIIQESVQDFVDLINNLNVEVLACYKDVFNYYYFIRNRCNFIIMSLFVLYTICIIFYYTISKNETIRQICSLTDRYILQLSKNKSPTLNKNIELAHCPVKKTKNEEKKKDDINDKGIKKYSNKDINTIKINHKINIDAKERKDKKKTSIHKRKTDRINLNGNNIKDIIKTKNKKDINNYNLNDKKSIGKINFKQINIMNLNIKPMKDFIKNEEGLVKRTKTSIGLMDKSSRLILNNKRVSSNLNLSINPNLFYNSNINKKNNDKDNDIDINEFLEESFDDMDYDDVVESDKRGFWQYFCEKIKTKQVLINSFFIKEIIKRRSIKIAVLIVVIDIYFLTDGLFFSDSYISKVFNSTEKETLFSFVPRSIDRFLYATIVGNTISYIINFFFIDENKIKQILLKNKNDLLKLRYEILELLKSIFKNIKILVIMNYILIIFSWYYLSCFNNVYPNLNNEWILSSAFLIVIFQILPFVLTFIETNIRFISIKCESEKLFKLSLLLS